MPHHARMRAARSHHRAVHVVRPTHAVGTHHSHVGTVGAHGSTGTHAGASHGTVHAAHHLTVVHVHHGPVHWATVHLGVGRHGTIGTVHHLAIVHHLHGHLVGHAVAHLVVVVHWMTWSHSNRAAHAHVVSRAHVWVAHAWVRAHAVHAARVAAHHLVVTSGAHVGSVGTSSHHSGPVAVHHVRVHLVVHWTIRTHGSVGSPHRTVGPTHIRPHV